MTHLGHSITACQTRGYTHKAYRWVKVMFIPKSRKANYTKAKSYHPISLSSVTLKTMGKLVDRHIRYKILGVHPLHRYQFAYQPQKSTETTVHHVRTHKEEAVENNEVTLGTFLDVQEAFDSTSSDIRTKAAIAFQSKGKAVLLQAWSGPGGSRKLRFPDFMTMAQDGSKVVSLTHRPPLPPGNTPGTHFC